MKKVAGFLLASILSSNIFAITLDGGIAVINKILMYEQGNLIYIYPAGGVQNTPACANQQYISYSMSRPLAKEYLSALLMAFAAGKTVEFRIEQTCVDQSTSATLSYFTIK